jgi:nicotinate-nucleotide adenylyltransferase
LHLERVVLMPASRAPQKASEPDPGPQHRLHMCELLVRDTAGVSACGLEIERGGASYTVDTLTAIHASHPDTELTLIVGADTASTIERWREPARLLELAQLAIAARAGTRREDVNATLEHAEGGARVTFLDMPVIEVSSSAVRERARRGEPIAELVGEDVAQYIEAHHLYRDRADGRG